MNFAPENKYGCGRVLFVYRFYSNPIENPSWKHIKALYWVLFTATLPNSTLRMYIILYKHFFSSIIRFSFGGFLVLHFIKVPKLGSRVSKRAADTSCHDNIPSIFNNMLVHTCLRINSNGNESNMVWVFEVNITIKVLYIKYAVGFILWLEIQFHRLH